jgi:LCP family protein required for cell wall assembly
MSESRDRSRRSFRLERTARPETAATIARHGRQQRSTVWKTVVGFIGGALVVALVAVGSVAAIALHNLQSDIKTVAIGADTAGPPPDIAAMKGGFNILLVGTDTRVGQGDLGGGVRTEGSGALNDVNILIHVAADQKSAVAVSIPRDMVVPIPQCSDGGGATGLPINESLSLGGLACVAATVENFTKLKVDFAGLITFSGVIAMSDAVGGVDVCTSGPIVDPDSGLDITSAGTHTLAGAQALAFLRTRHGVGDGSDLGRITSQQVYLSSLVRKIKSNDTLTDVNKLYGIAKAATANVTLSENFSRLDTLVSIALVLKKIPLDNIVFTQYPGSTGGSGIYAGKVQPDRYTGQQLMDAIKADKAIGLDADSIGQSASSGSVLATPAPTASGGAGGSGSTPAPSATDDPSKQVVAGLQGQTAGQQTCAVAYKY